MRLIQAHYMKMSRLEDSPVAATHTGADQNRVMHAEECTPVACGSSHRFCNGPVDRHPISGGRACMHGTYGHGQRAQQSGLQQYLPACCPDPTVNSPIADVCQSGTREGSQHMPKKAHPLLTYVTWKRCGRRMADHEMTRQCWTMDSTGGLVPAQLSRRRTAAA